MRAKFYRFWHIKEEGISNVAQSELDCSRWIHFSVKIIDSPLLVTCQTSRLASRDNMRRFWQRDNNLAAETNHLILHNRSDLQKPVSAKEKSVTS